MMSLVFASIGKMEVKWSTSCRGSRHILHHLAVVFCKVMKNSRNAIKVEDKGET
jgi:hypothetical protein